MLLPVWQVRQYALALALAEPSPRERKASEHRAILREARELLLSQKTLDDAPRWHGRGAPPGASRAVTVEVLARFLRGDSQKDIAQAFGVSHNAVTRRTRPFHAETIADARAARSERKLAVKLAPKLAEQKARDEARAAGAIRYLTTWPCKHGHTERYTSGRSGCVACSADRQKKHMRTQLGRLKNRLRSRVSLALLGKGPKTGRTFELLGASVETAREWIESTWLPGMSWSNHGEWEIDHIASIWTVADSLHDPVVQREVFHYTNLRALWTADNRSRPKNIAQMFS